MAFTIGLMVVGLALNALTTHFLIKHELQGDSGSFTPEEWNRIQYHPNGKKYVVPKPKPIDPTPYIASPNSGGEDTGEWIDCHELDPRVLGPYPSATQWHGWDKDYMKNALWQMYNHEPYYKLITFQQFVDKFTATANKKGYTPDKFYVIFNNLEVTND